MITEIHVTGDELNTLNKKVSGIHIPKQMTEQEYIQTCNTEQLVECLTRISFNTGYDSYNVVRRKIMEWLKQPHTPLKQDDCPCKVKGCSLETRQSCCGCPDYFEWEKQHKE